MILKYFVLFLLMYHALLSANTNCADTFDQLDQDCISSFEQKFQPRSFLIEKLAIDQVIFYKTNQGVLGKLKIIGKEISAGECSLYLESETFSNPKSYKTNTNLTINNKVGMWSNKEINLDFSSNSYDFILKRKARKNSDAEDCRLEILGETKAFPYMVMNETKPIEGNQLIFYAAIILIGSAAFLLVFNFLKEEEKLNSQDKLGDQSEDVNQSNNSKHGIILKYSKPFIKRYFVETVNRMKGVSKIKEKYKRPLANAGLTKVITPTEFYAFKFFLIITFPVLFLVLRWFFEMDLSVDYVYVASIVGYFYPDIWLKMQTNKRRDEMFLAMPFIVDTLALSIEAGLDFVAAISRVVEKAPPSALTDEFQIFLKEIKIGASRGDSLRQLSWRVDEISVNSFCATLIAADSVGASVGPVLKSLSRELRNKRSTLVEKKAAQAASKIMIPMILIILPAIFIIVIAPPMMEFFK